MVIAVETPQGLRTGSGVIEVGAANRINILPEGGVRSVYVRGQAVMVEMPSGGPIFALLKYEDEGLPPLWMALRVLASEFRKRDTVKLAGQVKIGQKAIIDREDYPILIRFKDIQNPTTIERIDPDNLAGSFGDGVVLRNISIEVTNDPVTTGIEEYLEWLSKLKGSIVRRPRDVNIGDMPEEHRLTAIDFRRGVR